MKKYIYKLIGCILAFCIIFLFCFYIIDMHQDGVVLRNGTYIFNTLYHDGTTRLVVDVYQGKEEEGTKLQLWPLIHSDAQQFELEHLEGTKYVIKNKDFCLGVNDETSGVIIESYDGEENQHWYIDRIGSSQYFKITNCESGLSMQIFTGANYWIIVAPFEEGENSFYFQLQ